ncbi:snoK [Modestobacter sp. I12A-02628]|uniref:Phytanoyl-CoA dioxygenase family protein n=1 Tax=Goekera deserti TaxID=2497753 RepID=A0A7K3WAQ6_9ACTN|nr:phytanoyl-CoA dioxygenase family protein [Goekera deserti]MPQ99260.1 snoK [Goekera deserti]NDI47595.1 snoK [Goekera deserti]NEL53406.1 phytanoyl-CoA dioxygenase family protein [Goekera deserti]
MSGNLSQDHAARDGLDRAWQGDNEQWWDWYLTLADNTDGEPAPLLEVSPPAAVPAPAAAELDALLAEVYPVTEAHRAAFARDGFVKLPAVLTPAALGLLRQRLVDLMAAGGRRPEPGRFTSRELMWTEDAGIAEFVLSRRLGRIVADLLGVDDVRVYHDNVLAKESGCGRTPWHFDDHHFPIDSQAVATVWLPLQATPQEMGPLSFARGTDLHRLVADVPFSTSDASYDRAVSAAFREAGVSVEDGPFELGELSVHSSLCFHTAGANRTTASRMVLATTYFADGARVVPTPTLVSGEWQQFLPGAAPGEVIDTPLNPVVSR